MLESELILADFLHEMDALDCLQSFELSCFPSEVRIIEEVGLTTPQTDSKQKENAPKTSRKRRNTSWLRRKQELHSLRHECNDLEAFLKRKRVRSASSPTSDTLTEDQAMWKSVAEIAKRKCQNSEDKNLRLKAQLQMYTQLLERLQTQLTAANLGQKLEHHKLVFANTFRVGMTVNQRSCFDDNEIYELLERRVDARFHELDSIISKTRHSTGEKFTENVQICREDARNTAVKFRYVRLLPFGEDATVSRLWEILSRGEPFNKLHTVETRTTSNVISLVAHHTISLNSMTTVKVHIRTVIKRFAVATGMVALCESRSEWSIHHPTAPELRCTTDEGGWFEVHELPLQSFGLPDRGNQRASQFLLSLKLRPKVPKVDNISTTRSFLTSTVVDIVIPSFSDIIKSHLQFVENYMLDFSAPSFCT